MPSLISSTVVSIRVAAPSCAGRCVRPGPRWWWSVSSTPPARLEMVHEHVDGLVDEPDPPVSGGVVGVLLGHQTGDDGRGEVEMARFGQPEGRELCLGPLEGFDG